jgi:M6 family metalloprotease-like protein
MSPTLLATLFAATAVALSAADADLKDFRTVATAKTATIEKPSLVAGGRPGYLGVEFSNGDASAPVVAGVEPGSPAQTAGIRAGDVITKLGDTDIATTKAFRATVQSLGENAEAKVRVTRAGKPLDLTATLTAASHPKVLPDRQPILGLRLFERIEGGDGLVMRTILANSAHSRAGLKPGDIILKIDTAPIRSAFDVSIALADHKPGDKVKLTLLRDGKEIELDFPLLAAADTDTVGPARNIWKKDTFRLGIICVEFPDVPHNAKITAENWSESIFSKGTYRGKNSATGQPVFGSFNDFYGEVSCGKFHVEGKVFDWVKASKKRPDYNQGTNPVMKAVLLNEAMDLLLARDGKDALDGYDGFFFLYAGERFPTTNRGSLYWPHRASFQRKIAGKDTRLSYFICPEGGKTMTNISVFCHEFGHMLGLPDLYARPENPGSEGVGVWCLMASELGKGRPQHMSAWCKEKLGWLKPAVIDPAEKQSLILAPVEGSATECFKVLIRRDASEYLLLENRQQRDFDTGLPAAGLLIWRVVGGHPILEESHGIEGPLGPRVFLNSIPFPSASGHAFTPDTRPSSHSLLGGGLPVHINEIRQLPDGRITFTIGHSYQ